MNQNSELSEREIEILKLVATGLSNKEIAYQLKISPNTVKVHLKNIFGKIGAVSRTEAAMYAVRMGWTGDIEITSGVDSTTDDLIQNSSQLTLPWYLDFKNQPIFIIGIMIIIISGFLLLGYINFANERMKDNLIQTPQGQIGWEEVGKLYAPLKSMAYTNDGEHIFIIGGETSDGVTNKMVIYNIQTNQQETGANKPTPVSEACAVIIGGKIFVGGGKLKDGSYSNAFEAYDINNKQWEKIEDSPLALAGQSCVTHEGKLYFLGGWDGIKVHSEIYVYTPTENRWTLAGTMAHERAFFGSTLINNRIYAIGGWQGNEAIKSIETFEVDDNKIVSNSELSLEDARYQLASISVLDKVYIIGGKDHSNEIDYSLEYNPANKEWREIKNPKNEEWSSFGLIHSGEYLYGFGGDLGGELSYTLYRLRVLYSIVLPVISQ